MTQKRRKRGTGDVRFLRGRWYARWRDRGRVREIGHYMEAEAEETLAVIARMRRVDGLSLDEALARLEGPVTPTGSATTFLEALGIYLAWCDREGVLKASTLKTNAQRAGVLRKAPWARLPMEDLTRRELRAWGTRRQADGASGKTVSNDLTLASSVFVFADEQGLIPEDLPNPFLRAKPKRFKRKERRALEPDGYRALLAAVKSRTPELWPLILANHFSGWRAGELTGLRHGDVRLDDDPRLILDGFREKTGKAKEARIGEPLVSMLRDRPGLPGAYLFVDETGRPWTRKTRLNRLRKALTHVPLEVIPQALRDGDDHHVPFDWHALRHGIRSIWESRGHRETVIGETMGQSDPGTQRRYSHGFRSESRGLADDMTAFLDSPKPAAENL